MEVLASVARAGLETTLDVLAYGWSPVWSAWTRLIVQSEALLLGLGSALFATGPLGPLVTPHWHQDLADQLIWTAVCDAGFHLCLITGRFILHTLMANAISHVMAIFMGLVVLPLALYPGLGEAEERSGRCWVVLWLSLGAGLSLGYGLTGMREAFRMPPLVVPGLVAALTVTLSKGRLAYSRLLQLVLVPGSALAARLLIGFNAATAGTYAWEMGTGYIAVCIAYALLDIGALQQAAADGFNRHSTFHYVLARIWLYTILIGCFGCCFNRPHFHHTPHP